MKRRRTLSSKASSWLFILPALTVVILLLLYPVTSSIFYSLTNKNLIKPTYRFLGLDNYIKTLTDPDFWTAFWNDLKWTFFSLLGQLIVGFTGALALNRIKKGSSIYRTILIIPWAIPSIVLAFSWKWILNGVYGFLPNLLIKLGLCSTAPEFLTGNLAFATLVFINIWFGSWSTSCQRCKPYQKISMKQLKLMVQIHSSLSGTLQFRIFVLLWVCWLCFARFGFSIASILFT